MLKFLDGNSKNIFKKIEDISTQRKRLQENKSSISKQIVIQVRKNKDKAIIKFEKKFNKLAKINKKDLIFSNKEIKEIINSLDKKTKKSIDIAYQRLKKFHLFQRLKGFKLKDNLNNILEYKNSPIDSVGIYVPGGTANYPSSVLMSCIPAIVAGVKKIYMTTPALVNKPNPAVIYAARKCGIKEIYKVGGAQAVAGLAYGTSIIKKVDKIVGPGNAFVVSAKKEVFGDVGIDMIAGPSEVTVVADKYSNPEWIAADLIAQAEHDKFSQSILISDDIKLIKKINKIIRNQLLNLPKKEIASYSLKRFGYTLFVKNYSQILKIINSIAPEHLELNLRKPNKILNGVKNAGSIFIGKLSPEAIGDYIAGPNHILPTTSSAKFSSGLSVFDFIKRHSLIKISKTGIERLGPSVINLARYENLEGHARSVEMRLNKYKGNK